MDTSSFIQQFESATGELAAVRESMVSKLRSFSASTVQMELPTTVLGDVGTEIDQRYASIESTQRSALESARGRIEQVHQDADASVSELISNVQSLVSEFSEQAVAHASTAAAELETFHDAVAQFDSAQHESEAAIDAEATEVAGALGRAQEVLEGHAEEIASTLTPQLESIIAGFQEAVEGPMTQSIEDAFDRGKASTLDTFQFAAAQVSQAFSGATGDLDRTAAQIESHVAESLRGNLEQGAEKLVEGATTRMAEEVIEGVVTSQTGVAVTTALGPYLPALIAIKRTTDVIKHGLELLKKVTTLGLG